MEVTANVFTNERFKQTLFTHDAFRACLDGFEPRLHTGALTRLRNYLNALERDGRQPQMEFPDGWGGICELLQAPDTFQARLKDTALFVKEAIIEAEDSMMLSYDSSPNMTAPSPGSPLQRRKLSCRSKSGDSEEGSDDTAAPEESISETMDAVRNLYERLLENKTLELKEVDLRFLFDQATQVFSNEANVVLVSAPAVIVGDIHGQIRDLKERVLSNGGPFGGDTNYLFLGDFVDRGDASLHCIALLAAAKILYPNKVFLLRGNHESRNTNAMYGYLSECHLRYPRKSAQGDVDDSSSGDERDVATFGMGSHGLWRSSNAMFDQLPVAAVLNEQIFCVHGGLSPRAETIAEIVACRRTRDVAGGVVADLTWSDPSIMISSPFVPSNRGCGQLFSQEATTTFLRNTGLKVVCRAHQCVRSGYLWDFNDQLVTVFSAPNYCGGGNDGAIMKMDRDGKTSFVTYKSALSWDDNEFDDPQALAGAADNDPGIASPIIGGGTAPAPVVPPLFKDLAIS